jgi:HAD superfamily hydrolase (TIGR01484 family)
MTVVYHSVWLKVEEKRCILKTQTKGGKQVKKLIAFDLDNTLAESKSQIPDAMGEALGKLLEKYDVCIISGGKFEQFLKQVINRLEVSDEQLSRLHIMPTCGTRYYRYEQVEKKWKMLYHNDLTADQKKRVRAAFESGAKKLGLWEAKPYGEIIEDRGSQMTYSALGQDIGEMLGEEGIKRKYEWDPGMSKRNKLKELIAPELDDLEVRVGGVTSIDVTLIGVDKAYGMKKLIEALGISKEEIVFVGDMLQEGGNDYPVRAMGIDWVEVENYKATPYVINGMLAVTE